MVTIKKISISQLPEYIDAAYRGDDELLLKYHTAIHQNTESAVISTMLMILDTSKDRELSYYKVCFKDAPIGYFVTFDKFLYSFGVNIKYRKKDILSKWWNEMKKSIGSKFMSGLYSNNDRAIRWLQKCGMKVYSNDNNLVTLIYGVDIQSTVNQSITCQY